MQIKSFLAKLKKAAEFQKAAKIQKVANFEKVAPCHGGEISRFLVGPKECEITGITWSADRKTMFVGIQHPGEKGDSHFPGGGDTVPRSSIIAVSREDGGLIG